MKTINLLTQERIKFTLFPDNQPHVNVSDVYSGDDVRVVCAIRSSLELLQLLETANAIDNLYAKKRELVITYLLGARFDRVMQQGDSHIGAIYGDSITLSRADEICVRLKEKGFASQVVFGIGSYTYQYNTRDTFGTAMKATHVTIDENRFEIFKSPVTDSGEKKSARGLLRVHAENGTYRLEDCVSFVSEAQGELNTVFLNGKLTSETTLSQIRERLSSAN